VQRGGGNEAGRSPRGGPDRCGAALPGRSVRSGMMRAAVPREPRLGREAVLGPRWDRPRASGPQRSAQGRTVRRGRWGVDEAVRARARAGRILAARQEAARAGGAFERGEGNGQIDGASDGRAPRGRGRPGVGGGGEHVFVKVGGESDGSGGVQPILQRVARRPQDTLDRPAATAKPSTVTSPETSPPLRTASGIIESMSMTSRAPAAKPSTTALTLPETLSAIA
jgi:hypothetical protein